MPNFTWGGGKVWAEWCNLQSPQELHQLMLIQKSAEQSPVQAAEWAHRAVGTSPEHWQYSRDNHARVQRCLKPKPPAQPQAEAPACRWLLQEN